VWNEYKRNGGMEEVIAKPSDSSFWKVITKMWTVMHDVRFWYVGDGQTRRVWDMTWIDGDLKKRKTVFKNAIKHALRVQFLPSAYRKTKHC
jgi:hypothetical protein